VRHYHLADVAQFFNPPGSGRSSYCGRRNVHLTPSLDVATCQRCRKIQETQDGTRENARLQAVEEARALIGRGGRTYHLAPPIGHPAHTVFSSPALCGASAEGQRVEVLRLPDVANCPRCREAYRTWSDEQEAARIAAAAATKERKSEQSEHDEQLRRAGVD